MAGGATSIPNTSRVPTVWNETTTVTATIPSISQSWSPGGEAGHPRLVAVEREHQEGPGADVGDGRDRHRGRQLDGDVRPRDAEHLAEEDARQVAGERVGPRHDDHAEGQHPDEEQADGRVARQPRVAAHEGDPADHHGRPDEGAADAGQAEQQRAGDAGQHPVRQGVADERQAAQHHERPDHRAGQRHEAPGHERAQHELVVDEGVDERAHRPPQPEVVVAGRARGRRRRPAPCRA